MSCIIYADLGSLIRKKDGCANNSKNFSTTKIGEHIPRGYSMSTIWVFDNINNFISWRRLYEKVLYFFRRTYYEFN